MTQVPLKKRWVKMDAWRGYYEYDNSVAGGSLLYGHTPHNDIEKKRISEIKKILKKEKIPHRVVTARSSNVFSTIYDIVVKKKDKKKAQGLINQVA